MLIKTIGSFTVNTENTCLINRPILLSLKDSGLRISNMNGAINPKPINSIIDAIKNRISIQGKRRLFSPRRNRISFKRIIILYYNLRFKVI